MSSPEAKALTRRLAPGRPWLFTIARVPAQPLANIHNHALAYQQPPFQQLFLSPAEMCLPVCRHGCFVFGVLINILLLALTIWCAESGKPFAIWVSLLIAFLLAFVFVVTISTFLMQSLRPPRTSLTCLQNSFWSPALRACSPWHLLCRSSQRRGD